MTINELRSRPIKYILENRKPIPIADDEFYRWARYFGSDDCIVARTRIKHYLVCTDFLGTDHNYAPEGEPLLFETMVKDYKNDEWLDYQPRYVTWEQSEQGHKKIVEMIKYKLRMRQKI